MSIRKRYWFTAKQLRRWAERLAIQAGKYERDWKDYLPAAQEETTELLRALRSHKLHSSEANARNSGLQTIGVRIVRDSVEPFGSAAKVDAGETIGRGTATERLKQLSPADRPKLAWVVDYVDQTGKRRFSTHAKEKDAIAAEKKIHGEIAAGTHVANSATITVKEAGESWVKKAELDGLEQSTVDQYRQHLNLHIVPYIGAARLARLTIPFVREFQKRLRSGDDSLPEDDARREPRSAKMVKIVTGSLGSILADAMEDGKVGHNVVREMSKRRRSRDKIKVGEGRHRHRPQVGADIPTPGEVAALIRAAEGRWRPLIIVAIYTGLRASELRGLRWSDVDLDAGKITVSQRADRYQQIGVPKSASSRRTIPIGPFVINTLREWKKECPKGKAKLVFPNGDGNLEFHVNIVNRGLIPTMMKAGITVDTGEKDDEGKPILVAKYTGLHCLRHFFASWCLNREKDGGRGLTPMKVKELLGHSSIQITQDIYGHLFPKDDDEALAGDEQKLLAAVHVA